VPENLQPPSDGKTREFLAITVSLAALAGVIVLSITIIAVAGNQRLEASKTVLSTVLPLVGTWIGTVLAFYFTKENFESAQRSVQDIAKQASSQDKLKAVPVQSKMIKLADMFFMSDPINAQTISSALTTLENAKKGDRIPILTSNKAVKYIIHRSILDRYLASKASAGGAPLNTLTFADLFKDRSDLEQLFARSFATIKPDASLADAQAAMESVKDCEDVFVTSQGGRQDDVVGWITDNIIQENLRA
jgi:hypothetical protein